MKLIFFVNDTKRVALRVIALRVILWLNKMFRIQMPGRF